jgi:hypothetical protein
VSRTMGAVLEPGEYVLNRSAVRAMAKGGEFAPAGPMPGAGGGTPIEVVVALDGQVVDAAIARSRVAGRMPRLERALRKPGVRTAVGFTRGSSNPWG